ncbi:hypothetical protein MOQ95_005755 [Salmonella enterica]|nr:hypothetical protein [Salmonella enterica]
MKKRKSNQRRYLLSGSVALLVLCPVAALAKLTTGCQPGTSYTEDKGLQTINLPLAPAEITLNKDSTAGSVVFEAPLQTFKFTCIGYTGRGGPSLHKGGSYDSFLATLTKANLKLQLKINGKNAWVPGVTSEFLSVLPSGSDYAESEKPETFDFPGGVFQLVLTKPVNRPVRVKLNPTSDIIAIYATQGSAGLNRVGIGTSNATKISAIPQCIGKTSVPAEVDLGRVITGGQGSLPSPRNFYIKPSFNRECAGLSDLSGEEWTGFALNLDIQFEVSNTGDLTPDHTRIRLKSENNTGDAQDNGLQLVIKKDGATPVKFNEWDKVNQAISIINNPLNLFYSASLEPVQGMDITQAKPGKFSQQVTVKVRYE